MIVGFLQFPCSIFSQNYVITQNNNKKKKLNQHYLYYLIRWLKFINCETFWRERERERAAAIHNFQHIPIFCRQKKLTRSSQIHAAQAGARHLEKNPRIFFYNNKKKFID